MTLNTINKSDCITTKDIVVSDCNIILAFRENSPVFILNQRMEAFSTNNDMYYSWYPPCGLIAVGEYDQLALLPYGEKFKSEFTAMEYAIQRGFTIQELIVK